MKKIFLSLLLGSSIVSIAQETTINDALRYATSNLYGTARFRGMSGAFGAVGGDLSSINVNPAGSAFFTNNFGSVSGTSFNVHNNSNYFGTRTKENFSTLDLNQIGAVLVFNDKSGKSNWSKIAVAINYENTNNFDNNLFSAGVNPNNSIGNYFIDKAQGLPLEFLELQTGETITDLYTYLGETSGLGFPAQQAMLGYQAYLFEAFDDSDPNNVDYYTNVPTGGNYFQDNYVTSNGFNGKLFDSGDFKTAVNDILEILLHRDDIKIEIGDEKFRLERSGHPAEHLSEGEKSAIGFAYFLTELKSLRNDDPSKLPNTIIFIDDPISSLDSNHIFFVYSLINAEIIAKQEFEQIFISTHNLDFLKYLKRLPSASNKNQCAYFLISREKETSKINV